MRQKHLAPILSVVPLIAFLLIFPGVELGIEPIWAAGIAIGFVLLNVLYAVQKKTFQMHTLVEFALVGLIAYFVLTSPI